MKTLDVVQGTEAWLRARLGRPTASCFNKIVTPAKGKLSESSGLYMYQLLAEWMLGHSLGEDENQFMQRGSLMEQEAVAYYELQRGIETAAVGFITTDDGRAGCSPDRFVGETGGLEIKCPSPAVHIGYLLNADPVQYRPQIQGALWITGRDWWDFLSYHPTIPSALLRFPRDEAYIALLGDAVTAFCDRLDEAKARLREMGVEPADVPEGDELPAFMKDVLA